VGGGGRLVSSIDALLIGRRGERLQRRDDAIVNPV
jgi:hypothetical protein